MSQLNVRIILKILGIIHLLESLFMLSAAIVGFVYDGGDFGPLIVSTGIMAAFGAALYVAGRNARDYNTGRREGVLTVTLTWFFLSLFGMLPYLFGGYTAGVTDAFFETMSGFTTTGATIFTDVEVLPRGILFWRSLTQWQGGIGIIVFTVALMPFFRGTATLIFDAESSGITHDHFLPRVTQVAKRLFAIYVGFTLVLFGLLWAGPMSGFDALNHTLTTVASGGYSTRNASIAYWNSAYVEYVIALFMCFSATNITLFYFLFNRKPERLLRDEETRWFYAIVAIAAVVVAGWLVYRHNVADVETAFRQSLFQVVSLITTTGYQTADHSTWGSFFTIIALMLMVVCGCAGSTSGGLKVGRFVILIKNMLVEFKKQTHPQAIIPVRVSGHVVHADVVHRVLTFTFVYALLIAVGSAVLLIDGVGFDEAIGSAVSATGNVGLSLGQFSSGNMAALPTASKWVLSFLMVAGRLEIFTVLALLTPGFWRQ